MKQNWLVRYCWICFVGLFFLTKASVLFPRGAWAEDSGVILMEEIVVTATKTTEKRKDIPNAVILMDSTDIQASPAKSLGELLSNELGVDWRTQGNYGGAVEEIHVRGMSGNATQVRVNGVTINSPSVGVADVSRIPLNNIERIEVVKGSGSVLYGSGAMGGTVNIITKRPKKDKMDLNVAAGYGSQNTYQVSAEQGMFVVGDFGYYLTANQRETDGFRDNSDLEHNDVSLKLVLEKGDDLDISLYGDYIEREYGVPGVEPPPGTQDYYVNGEKFYNNEAASLVNNGSDKDAHVILQIKSRPTEWLGFNLKGDYTSMRNYYYRRDANPWWPSLPGEGEKTWVTSEVQGAEGNVDIKPFESASLVLGVDYKDYDYKRETQDLDITGVAKPETKESDSYNVHTKGAFTEAQYRPCKFFKVLAGIRHENHSMFGNINLPRYGLIINPLEETAIKLSLGKHFRAPTMNELYWPEDDFARGNPDLNPETGWHSDATIDQSFFDEKLFITLSYFKWDVDDKINWAENPNFPGPWGNKWTPSNVDTYKAKGWEFGTKIGPFCDVTLVLNYTYTDAEEAKKGCSKRQAVYTPKNQFKGNLIYRSNFGMTVTTTVQYMDERPAHYNTNTDTEADYILSSYWTTDAKLEQCLYDHWVLSLQWNNLFDKGYGTYMENFTEETTGITTMEEYPGAGRSVFFSVTYEY